MPVQSTCPQCGTVFPHPPKPARTYCSKRCRYAAPRLPLADRFYPKVKPGPLPDRHPEYGVCRDWTGTRHKRPDGSLSYGYLKPRNSPAILAHRAAWTLASGEAPPDDRDVLHTCDRTQCTQTQGDGVYTVNGIDYPRRGHLWLGDHMANMADRTEKERSNIRPRPGVLSPAAKLNDAAIADIRTRYATGRVRQQTLADEYGVNNATISMIVNGIRWGHLDGAITMRQRAQTTQGLKLTEHEALAIRAACDSRSMTQAAIALQYGVILSTVAKISQRKLWAQLEQSTHTGNSDQV